MACKRCGKTDAQCKCTPIKAPKSPPVTKGLNQGAVKKRGIKG